MPIDYKRDYHIKWSLIRRLILKRANHCCEECGVKNYELGYRIDGEFLSVGQILDRLEETGEDLLAEIPGDKKPMKIILTVAHLDHDTANNKFENLRAWCQRCHLNYDRNDNTWRKKYGKNSHRIQHKLELS